MREIIYIHPGYSQCRVYAIWGKVPKGKHPRDLDDREWIEIGLLNNKLEVVYLKEFYQCLKDEIEGQMGGTYFEINWAEWGMEEEK